MRDAGPTTIMPLPLRPRRDEPAFPLPLSDVAMSFAAAAALVALLVALVALL